MGSNWAPGPLRRRHVDTRHDRGNNRAPAARVRASHFSRPSVGAVGLAASLARSARTSPAIPVVGLTDTLSHSDLNTTRLYTERRLQDFESAVGHLDFARGWDPLRA